MLSRLRPKGWIDIQADRSRKSTSGRIKNKCNVGIVWLLNMEFYKSIHFLSLSWCHNVPDTTVWFLGKPLNHSVPNLLMWWVRIQGMALQCALWDWCKLLRVSDGMGQHWSWTQMTWVQCLAVPHTNLVILGGEMQKLNDQNQGHEGEQR